MNTRRLPDGRRTSALGPVPNDPPTARAEGRHPVEVDLTPLDAGVTETWDLLREVEDELLSYEQRERAHSERAHRRTADLSRKYGVQR